MFHVVVADHSAMRVYETNPDDGVLVEVAAFRNEAGNRHERDLVSSRPGRVINRAAGISQTFEPRTSAKRHSTQLWMKLVGVQLQQLLTSRHSEAVILVGTPRVLGELRRQFPASVRALIRAQIARDLMHHPINVLAKRVQPVVRMAARATLHGLRIYRPLPMRTGRAPGATPQG